MTSEPASRLGPESWKARVRERELGSGKDRGQARSLESPVGASSLSPGGKGGEKATVH